MIHKTSATAYNSTYVHRRPFGVPRATRRCGAPLRHMALRPGWAQGHVTYVRFVICNCANVDLVKTSFSSIFSASAGALLYTGYVICLQLLNGPDYVCQTRGGKSLKTPQALLRE